jgi:hypothetical protein
MGENSNTIAPRFLAGESARESAFISLKAGKNVLNPHVLIMNL